MLASVKPTPEAPAGHDGWIVPVAPQVTCFFPVEPQSSSLCGQYILIEQEPKPIVATIKKKDEARIMMICFHFSFCLELWKLIVN